ncbi:MAG: hypothetical protein II117_05620 [Clostridia bacterium]|nr:hypothetical protein [Clostridia bacterium]
MLNRFYRNGILTLLSLLLLFAASGFSVADEVEFGDADGDGAVTAQDASCISRHLKRFHMMDAAALSRADYDGDGTVTSMDAALIMNASVNPEESVNATASFSMLVTSDMKGLAWDVISEDEESVSTAMNVAACVMSLREQEPDLLLLDAGGSLLGSSIADDYPSRTERMYGPMSTLFIMMKYDAVLLGKEAITYPSQTVRREVNALLNKKIPVLGMNLQMSNPTVYDPEGVLWNELSPYVFIDVPQGEDAEPLRVALVGVTDPSLATYDDEVLPVDPLESYKRFRKEIKSEADYTILIYYGNIEVDASSRSSYSLRDLIRKTDGIDLVLCAHSDQNSTRAEKNSAGYEIPIVSLPGGTEKVTRVSVSLRENGRPAISVAEIDASEYEPSTEIRKNVRPYVSKVSAMMDAVVCTVGTDVEAYDPNDRFSSSDSMELLHEMQLFSAAKWIAENDLDLPNNIISVAYPYLSFEGLREGTVYYRDLCRMRSEMPRYTLLLVRGCELKAWLSGYADSIMTDETVYSLYGVSYLINSLNSDSPLGFLEHSSGLPVEDDEVFALILAENPEEESSIRSYLDETWMTYADRVVEGFTLPRPERLGSTGENAVTDALTAYLETVGELRLSHTYTWIVI